MVVEIYDEKGNLGRKVVTIKYGVGGFSWSPSLPYGSYGQSLWRHIALGWGRFFPHFSFDFSDGSIVFSQLVWWCEEAPLGELFCAFFILVVDKDASVAYYREILDI